MSILFSEFFKLTLSGKEEWFDPIIGRDTKLFIDPFLVQKLGHRIPEFQNTHLDLIAFFNGRFTIAAKLIHRDGPGNRELLRSLEFPEAHELHLGYSRPGNPGAGSAKGYSRQLLTAMFELIDHGITSIQRFEELPLFKEGFGADRIGDMMANLMRPALISYTQRVCASLKVPLTRHRLRHVEHTDGGVWEDAVVELPVVIHPQQTENPVLLVPGCFLRNLPTIDVTDFWDYCFSHENQALRDRFGQGLKKGINRKKIFEVARQSEKLRQSYLRSLASKEATPYDLESDPELHHKWYSLGKEVAASQPLALSAATNDGQFFKIMDSIVERFKHYVEQRGGWEVLRDDMGKGRKEPIAQRLFDGITSAYCEANNIDYSPEVDSGRGPVDFKFSSGFSSRTLIEVKLARNSKLLEGLNAQLPIYMKAEKISRGTLLVIAYEDEDDKKINALRQELPAISKRHGIQMEIVHIDARRPQSASKARERRRR